MALPKLGSARNISACQDSCPVKKILKQQGKTKCGAITKTAVLNTAKKANAAIASSVPANCPIKTV